MSDFEKLKLMLDRSLQELTRGIDSLDNDDQILAVVIMRLVCKRIEDMQRMIEND
jgi:hypothetical protein